MIQSTISTICQFFLVLLLIFGSKSPARATQTPSASPNCSGLPQLDLAFNNLNNTFIQPHDSDSSTPIGNLTLFIRENFFTDNFGNATSISLNFTFIEPGESLVIDGIMFRIDGDGALGIGSEQRLWTPQMTNGVTINSTEYSKCMSGNTSYFSIQVTFLLQKGPRLIGTRRWVIDLLRIGTGVMSMEVELFNLTVVTVVAKPIEGCDQHYIFENNSCVTTCPCNLKTFPDFCFEFSGGDFSRAITDVTVPASKSDGAIATIYVLLDQNILSVPDNQMQLTFTTHYIRGDQMHDERPIVELSILPSNLEIQNPTMNNVFLMIPIMSINVTTLKNCGQYKILPLQFNLVSSSFYQLGEHIINIGGSVHQSQFVTQIVVNVTANTTCTDEPNNLVDLPNQQCVSECSCGFVPFRATTIPYCEPAGIARPARLGDDQLRVEVEVETAINETIRLYTNSMFLTADIPGFDRNILLKSTDSVTVMLRVEQVSSSTLQPSLQFDNELGQSLDISLNNNNLSSRGLEECDEEPNSYIPISIIIPEVSEAGQYTFDVVARFTSTVNDIEQNLRDLIRFVNVTHALRVDLEVTSITPTIVSTTMLTSSTMLTSTTSETPTSSPDPDLADQVIVVLSIEIFTLEKRRTFQETVADTVSMHCQSNQDECRNKRQAVTVQANDVVITKVMNVSKGVQLHFYVDRMGGGVIPPGTVVNAVEANPQPFVDNNITVVDIMEAVPPVTSTPVASTPVTSPPVTTSPPGPPVGGIIGGVVILLIAITITVVVILVVLLVIHHRQSGLNNNNKSQCVSLTAYEQKPREEKNSKTEPALENSKTEPAPENSKTEHALENSKTEHAPEPEENSEPAPAPKEKGEPAPEEKETYN